MSVLRRQPVPLEDPHCDCSEVLCVEVTSPRAGMIRTRAKNSAIAVHLRDPMSLALGYYKSLYRPAELASYVLYCLASSRPNLISATAVLE